MFRLFVLVLGRENPNEENELNTTAVRNPKVGDSSHFEEACSADSIQRQGLALKGIGDGRSISGDRILEREMILIIMYALIQ